ncbi:hypothetical protein KAFR_0B01450 [Kazachstania africana CBS 2517]|uniref:Zn(2)-C6 fungal-type domain-containing protein n=1 Tax=Kazachstania africana (strain ATCC 22294 / BCRC 22015 / CBS 2517 / CECT 1963 / NBRC 1671 / NRRL Y-8276) TaxID=1071382 RepID=H2APZ4_KAZAF|nr:hypothetical protein KAFR_0B01450 [Kazachstania africana CBS 2517]CCF56444.1 hypothetical protein KAFR_0B01450 [Kazachstania africana CBS 2517]
MSTSVSNAQQVSSAPSDSTSALNIDAIESARNNNTHMTSNTEEANNASRSSSNKRRTKASRACDQCRKKKVKCDNGDDRSVCTNCQRNGEKCTFERVPLKRGPSKGYSKSGHKGKDINNKSPDDIRMRRESFENKYSPSSPARSNSVLLPPLSHYIPQNNYNSTTSNKGSSSGNIYTNIPNNSVRVNSLSTIPPQNSNVNNNSNISNFGLGQQQFWKVPYHEFPHQRRGSIDSLPSDISVRTMDPQQQMFYSQHQRSPSSGSQTGNNYWSFFRSANSASASQNDKKISSTNSEPRRSSSIPSLLRQPSTNGLLDQPQLPHPDSSSTNPQNFSYSQFHQQPNHIGHSNNHSLSAFGQYATAGFQSRNNSITSDAMSPNEPIMYQQNVNAPLPTNATQRQDSKSLSEGNATPSNREISKEQNSSSQTSSPGSKNGTKKRKRNPSSRRSTTSKGRNSVSSLLLNDRPAKSHSSPASNIDAIHDTSSTATSVNNTKSSSRHTMIYGQISDVDLIDLYYEFIHIGLPIIPLNKKTLTNDILLVNTQPISAIHELNNYVILWFRNSLELLIKIAIKQDKNIPSFFNSFEPTIDDTSISKANNASISKNSGNNDESKAKLDSETQSFFISTLNECFQKIVDIHPKLREHDDEISPKIKVIYLSTFIILNYVLSFVGHDNSFVLGMSVTIFNEFKLYKLLLSIGKPQAKSRTNSIETDVDCSILFKRLYVLLIIFDSIESCTYGSPKLLNIPIHNTTELYFDNSNGNNFDSKWTVEENPNMLKIILQSLKLGEFVSELAMNRKSMNNFLLDNNDPKCLIWEPKTQVVSDKNDSSDGSFFCLPGLFHKLLLTKRNFINLLLSLNGTDNEKPKLTIESTSKISDTLCELINQILQILTSSMRLNPTNSIDPNYRPSDTSQHSMESTTENNATMVLTTPTQIPTIPSDFYQRLLGLSKEKERESDVEKGIVSPFAIPIIYELHNIINILKQLPTQLIGIIMRMPHEFDNTAAQSQVVKLSNSMNEVVQIMSLLNLVKPFKIFDNDLSQRCLSPEDDTTKDLVMKWKFLEKGEVNKTDELNEKFIDIGWKLLDDSELGWF